jgi:glycosyltransferase involved in cell wall biosynthesis
MARIGFDATLISAAGKGVSRFLCLFLSALAEFPTPHHFIVFINERTELPELPAAPHLHYISVPVRNSLTWDMIQLPRVLKEHRIDLLQTCSERLPLTYNGPMMMYLFEVPKYRNRLGWRRASTYARLSMKLTEALFPISLRRAACVVVSSKATQATVMDEYGVSAKKVAVVYPGGDSRFTPRESDFSKATMRERLNAPDGYILHFSSVNDGRDNTSMAVQALHRSLQFYPHAAKLVIAGRTDPVRQGLAEMICRLQLEDRVVWTGFVPDDDLVDIYCSADVYLDPSLYEGFGYQVLEAMSCGVPVICSNVTSLPEVVGDAAITVSPDDEEGFASAIVQVLSSPDLAGMLREKGFMQAKQFNWSTMLQQMHTLYEHVL